MRLYIYCDTCNTKVYLNSDAKTRNQLARQWGVNFYITCPHCHSMHYYHVNQVRAEASSAVVPGALVGGIVGILGGPLGMIIGGTVGGAVSNNAAKRQVENFNDYYVNV